MEHNLVVLINAILYHTKKREIEMFSSMLLTEEIHKAQILLLEHYTPTIVLWSGIPMCKQRLPHWKEVGLHKEMPDASLHMLTDSLAQQAVERTEFWP